MLKAMNKKLLNKIFTQNLNATSGMVNYKGRMYIYTGMIWKYHLARSNFTSLGQPDIGAS